MPVPPVLRVYGVERDGRWFLPNLDRSRPTALAYLPPEVYLRQFRDTPADDLDALAELCKLGWIVLLHEQPYRDLPVKDDEEWKAWLARLEVTLWPREPIWAGDEAEREAVWARHHSLDLGPAVHAAEVAARVRAMQRTTNHLLAYLDDEPVAPAWPNCTDDLGAWRNFIDFTGAALRGFHVRVELEAIDGPEPPEETSLYSAAMLQLVNDLAANETIFHTCANETCRRRFVRQLGRSAYGGHRRSGTRYCTNTCARAQYQREKRRRDRAARKGTTR